MQRHDELGLDLRRQKRFLSSPEEAPGADNRPVRVDRGTQVRRGGSQELHK